MDAETNLSRLAALRSSRLAALQRIQTALERFFTRFDTELLTTDLALVESLISEETWSPNVRELSAVYEGCGITCSCANTPRRCVQGGECGEDMRRCLREINALRHQVSLLTQELAEAREALQKVLKHA